MSRPRACLARLASLAAVTAGIAALTGCGGSPPSGSGRIHPDAESVQPLPVGARAPEVVLETVEGEPLALADLDGALLLVFYRGGW